MSDGRVDMTGSEKSPRGRILEAALAVFGAKGFSAATTKEIAAKAQVNEVTVFRTFRTKTELFHSALSERFPRTRLMRDLHFDRNLDASTVLEENSVRLLKVLHDNRDLMAMIALDLPRMDRGQLVQNDLTSTFTGPLSGYLASQMESGSLQTHDPELAASIFFGMLQSYYVKSYIERNAPPYSINDLRHVRTMVDIFLGGLRTKRDEPMDNPSLKKRK